MTDLVSLVPGLPETDSFKQNRNDTDKKEQIISEESPDEQRKAFRASGKDPVEVIHEAAFLGAAGTGKRRIACADKQQETESQQLAP